MRYEYKVLKFDVTGLFSAKVDFVDMERQLNELGSDGWQLVKVSTILKDTGITKLLVAVMQRPRD
jgi:hypothetical protein